MASREEMQMHQAQINRSIRSVKAELEYLCDASVISPQTLTDLLSRIPAQTQIHAPISVGAVPASTLPIHSPPPPQDSTPTPGYQQKAAQSFYASSPGPPPPTQNHSAVPAAPPPSYGTSPAPPPAPVWAAPPPLATASALYAYSPTDDGDLELQPNDRIVVTEYMNAEWWKGRNERTGCVGIFPRSYVKVVDDEKTPATTQQGAGAAYGNNYGNQPLEVSQMGNGNGKVPSKFEAQGKKFGKKLGNAAIFGAGATLGADVVNSIF